MWGSDPTSSGALRNPVLKHQRLKSPGVLVIPAARYMAADYADHTELQSLSDELSSPKCSISLPRVQKYFPMIRKINPSQRSRFLVPRECLLSHAVTQQLHCGSASDSVAASCSQ